MVTSWKYKKLPDVLKNGKDGIKIGPFGSQLKKEFLITDGTYRVYGQENVYADDFSFGKRFLSVERFQDLKSCELVPGDIVISTMGTIGKCAIVPDNIMPGIMDSHLIRLRTDDSVNKNYFKYYIQSEQAQKHIKNLSVGGIMDGLSTAIIRKIVIAIPPPREQQDVAAALSDVDAYISSLEKLIAKKCSIKQGAMQELLTSRRRLPGFDGEWVEKRVGNIGYTYSGLLGKQKENFGVGNARYITFLNVLLNTVIDTTNLESVEVSESEKQNAVQCGDLFFNTSSETPCEVGMCAVLNKPLNNTYLNSFCFGFRLTDDDIDGLYLSYFFNGNEGRKIMTLLAQGATRYNLSKAYFNEIVLHLPRKSEQTAIASVLSDMDAEIEKLRAKLEKAKCIKQGMMSELLTGRIRLVEEETDNVEN